MQDETLPGWLGPKQPNVEGPDDTQTYGKHLPFCPEAEGGASGNPPEPMGTQVPTDPNLGSHRASERRGRGAGAGCPCFPNTLQAAEVILAGVLPSGHFHSRFMGPGVGGADKASLRMSHLCNKLDKVHFNCQIPLPSHTQRKPSGPVGSRTQTPAKPECLFLGDTGSGGPRPGLLSGLGKTPGSST